MDAERFRDEQRALRELVGRRRRGAGDGERPLAPPDAGAGTPIEGGPFVSVIVVCWNAAEVLGRCLEQLLAQDYANREIVVVDDGSSDGTFEVAERASARAPLTLVRSERNRGCPAARNLGLRHAGGEIVAFIDADGFADRRWLSRVVAAFGEDETIGGIASTVFYDDNPIVLNGAGGTVNRQGWAADLSMNESFEFAELAGEALYPMGCGMALRRTAIERVGPFDGTILNYYDDVDYGIRLWRAGFRVKVAQGAWIDHAAALGDSSRKRLLCERHRMRVVLKHTPASLLGRWAARELRELRAAGLAVRVQKLRALAWNAWHLPTSLAGRRRLRGFPAAPAALVADSWGDGFPAGVALRPRTEPELAREVVDITDPGAEKLLTYGWFPAERIDGRGYRWAAVHAAALVSLAHPARCLRLDYAHVPADTGGVELRVRRVGEQDSIWRTYLHWQYISRSVENHPLALEPGDYEVVFAARAGWSDPPRETRSLALALAALQLSGSFDVSEGDFEMGRPTAEEHLVSGWFEAEAEPGGRAYRWAGRSAAVVVRIARDTGSVRLVYRTPPRGDDGVLVSIDSLERGDRLWSATLEPTHGDWRDPAYELDLRPGGYVVAFEASGTWTNPDGREPSLPPERRALGFALSAVSFAS
jgi:GT2 family glycosyltransferase